MLMSYPQGTSGEDVRDITAAVCREHLQNDDRNFDYIIAVHEDRAHPHEHVVLNRRSQEGEYFYLGRDHHFNYDDFRLSMVEHAEKVGLRGKNILLAEVRIPAHRDTETCRYSGAIQGNGYLGGAGRAGI